MRRKCGLEGDVEKLNVQLEFLEVMAGSTYTVVYKPSFQPSASQTTADTTSKQTVYTIKVEYVPVNSNKILEIPGEEKRSGDRFHMLEVTPLFCKSNDQSQLLVQQYATGHIAPDPKVVVYDTRVLTEEEISAIPTAVDWRTINGKASYGSTLQYNQGSCGSCYAWASTIAFAYRLEIKGIATPAFPSPQSAMSCTGGCGGGNAYSVYGTMVKPTPITCTKADTQVAATCASYVSSGFCYGQNADYMAAYCCASCKANYNTQITAWWGGMPPFWCNTYTSPATATTCSASCGTSLRYEAANAGVSINKQSAGSVAAAETAIMNEIATNGPAYVALMASDAFSKINGWAINSATDSVGSGQNHAVTLVGYGVDAGVKYWIIHNSWGAQWGSAGFARIARGADALGVETGGIISTTPVLPATCTTTKCMNGGGVKSDCTCQCASGWSGATCETCARTCTGGNLGGTAYTATVNGQSQCLCGCKAGYYTVGSTECGTSISIGGVATVTSFNPITQKLPISFALVNPEKIVSDGWMYVAVKTGVEPYTSAGWAVPSYQVVVCGQVGGPYYCGDRKALTTGYSSTSSYFDYTKFVANTLYDVYLYKWLGKNEFGIDKGFAMSVKLSQQIKV